MDSEALRRWIVLGLLPGMNPARIRSLWQRHPSPDTWPRLDTGDLALCGLGDTEALQLAALAEGHISPSLRATADSVLDWTRQPGNRVIPLPSPDYPPLLREIPDPPPLLYVRGDATALHLPQIAIVGTRKPSADGRRTARRLAGELAGIGYHITSGLALGIDTASHQGALEAEGRTIAVLGSGLDCIYPRQNRALADRIVERGALISEFPPDAGPASWHFPQRNRVISGLSHGVLVIEAAARSGSLITARLAMEQGREVFAVPGSIHNPVAGGCHQLLRHGAKLVERVDDLLEELPALLHWERQRTDTADAAQEATPSATAALEGPARALLDEIAWQPVSIDQLALQTRMSLPDLYTHLTTLEMEGFVLRANGGYVRIARE